MKQKYDVIISLGEDCACSMYLKMNNLRYCSLPFDWLTNASLEKRFDLILNDFQNFLNIEDLKIIDKTTLGHPTYDNKFDYYENTKNGFHFYHDFLHAIPMERSIQEVSKKYERRIGRLYELLKNKKRILFVWLSHAKFNDDKMILDKFQKICEKFNKNIDFLIIENDVSKNNDECDMINLSDNIKRIKIKTHLFDDSIENKTLGCINNCNKIFKSLDIKKTTRSIFFGLYIKLFFIIKKIIKKCVNFRHH